MKKTNTIYAIICICGLIANTITAQSYGWVNTMAGTSDDEGKSIALDASGNVFTVGFFEDTVDFDPGPGIFNLISEGGKDIFITKHDASGNFISAGRIGGTENDEAKSISIDDSSGNIYITGSFRGTVDFDPDPAITYNLISEGLDDVFVLKLDGTGTFLWAKSMGGTASDIAYSIISDLNVVYVTGHFVGTADFDGTTLTSEGGRDMFILKFNDSGLFMYAKSIGGSGFFDSGQSIIADRARDIYITGYFEETVDFDPDSATTYNLSSEGGKDIFILKLDISGDFIWAKRMGGTSDDIGYSITVDISNVYTTGSFAETADFDPDSTITYNLDSEGGTDIFISTLDSSGDFVWAKSMGGTEGDAGRSIAIDIAQNVYTTGSFEETVDFDPGAGTYDLIADLYPDVFISKLDASGNFVGAKSMEGGQSVGLSITIDASRNIYTTGHFLGTIDFDPGTGIENFSSVGFVKDIFVHKLFADSVLGIFDNNFKRSLVAFPNPTTKNITINLGQIYDEITLNVRNVMGQLISTANYKTTNNIDFSINGSPGMYFFEVLADSGKRTSLKVIKN